MRNVVGLWALGFVLVLEGQAGAQVLTFDELPATDNPILGSIVCADGTGFRFFSDHFHQIGFASPQDFSSNGTTHIGYESGRGFPVTMERVGGGTFSLLSLDAAEYYSHPVPDRPDAEMLTIVGFQQGGGTVSHTLPIDGIYDGPGGVPDFEHFTLPNTFVNLTSVVFTGLRAGNLAGGVAIDNIEYQLAAPETLAACVVVPLPSDTPTVSFVSPAPGNVMGTVLVEAAAADNAGVSSVQFRLDGVDLGAADVTAPYSISWDTTTVPDGPRTLTAEARDAANNVATATVTVNVRNHTVVETSPNYLDFDGVDDYLEVADANAVSFGTGAADTPLTIETWLRPDAMAKHQVIGKWGASGNTEYRLYTASGVLRFDIRDASAGATVSVYTGSQVSLVGSWHHLAVTYDGRGGATAANGITFYIDGIAVPVTRVNNAAYVAMENLTAPLQIGRESFAWKQYDGGLDELRMWDVARTVSEIQAAMAIELSGSEPGLVAYWRFNDGVGATAADDSPADHTATLFNGTTWVPGGPLAPVEPDVTPPEISGIITSNVTASGFTVEFTTSEVATGWVSYTATGACPCTDAYSGTPRTTHLVTLTGLAPDTIYEFAVKATDAATNLTVSPTMSVRTLVPPPDTTPPTVTFVRPSGNVLGTVIVEATATDNLGVASVQFKLDGVNLGAADVAAPYSTSWDTTTAADGPHTLTADAYDVANNVAIATVSVNVSQTPVPTTPHYLDFDGANGHLTVPDAADLSFGTGAADMPLTIETWFRPDAMGKHQLIGKWGENGNTEYKLYIASGVIRLDMRDSSAAATVSVYSGNHASLVGSWHHLAVTYDGRGGATATDGVAFYIDGVAVPVTRVNNAVYVAMENLAAPLQIGRESVSWKQYHGGLDELRLWNVARSASDIQATMTLEVNGATPGLVAYWRFNEGAGGTAADDSQGHTATLFSGTAWVSGGPMAPVAPDVTEPQIAGIATSNLTALSVTVSFTTNEVATGWVSYTATGACPCTDVYSGAPGTTHVVSLSGLAPDTVYEFVVKATDASANLAVSPAMSVRTLVPPPDTVPATVSIVRPLAGNVSGTVLVEATATDNLGVASVQFKLDGVDLGVADTTAPYSIGWDTTTVPDGPHTLTAEARDAANNVATSASVAVNVSQVPVATTPSFLDFDGVDDYVEVSDATALSFGTGTADTPLTIETWFRPDAMGKQQLIGKWVDDGNAEYKLYTASGIIRFDVRDNSAGATVSVYNSSSQLSLVGSWHHLAVTYDGRGGPTAADGITFYIDGVPVPVTRLNNAAYVAMENLTAPLQIGRESVAWKQYDGGLDELRMWNVARTAIEIQSAMMTGLSGAEPGLVAYWRFNDGAGVTAMDASPAGHAAHVLNSTAWVAGGPPVP